MINFLVQNVFGPSPCNSFERPEIWTFVTWNQMSCSLLSLTQTWMNVPREYPHVRRCAQTLLDHSPAAAEKVTNWILISSLVQVRRKIENENIILQLLPDRHSVGGSDCIILVERKINAHKSSMGTVSWMDSAKGHSDVPLALSIAHFN